MKTWQDVAIDSLDVSTMARNIMNYPKLRTQLFYSGEFNETVGTFVAWVVSRKATLRMVKGIGKGSALEIRQALSSAGVPASIQNKLCPGQAVKKRKGNWNPWNAPGGNYIRRDGGDRRFLVRCLKEGKPIPPGLYHIEKTIVPRRSGRRSRLGRPPT